MANASLNGRLKTVFKHGWFPQHLGESIQLYNLVRRKHDLAPTKRLSSSLAKPNASDANMKLRKTAHLRDVAVGGRAIAQADTGGIEACPWRTNFCTAACLGDEGNYLYPRNQRVKLARKEFEFRFPHHAWSLYHAEIGKDRDYAKKRGWDLYWRPDIISDSEMWRHAPEIFADYPDVTFYGYTKNWRAAWEVSLAGWVLPNYRIAFSASELDQNIVGLVNSTLVNVAVVFDVSSADELPATYDGVRVVNAIDDDTWMLQYDGVIGGLKPIGQKMRNDCSGFVRRDFVRVNITSKEEVAT